jgi:ABC-type transport system involved in multi-copper enzyme maturation permease subunit
MFSTLLMKEIQETLNNNRSLISAVLCLILIPLGIYISAKDYEKRLDTYKEADKAYHENAEGKLRYDFNAEGYRPPSPFSMFSKGLEDVMPDKVITHNSGIYSFHKEWGINNPVSVLFGNIDFMFITAFILSLLALINTFSSVSGEKDTGTLKLMVSNPVNRWKIILAKIMGPYLVFAVFFVLGVVISLLLLVAVTNLSMSGGQFWMTVMVILMISLAYLFIMFALGTFISALTSNAVSSIVILLFIWVLFFAVIPKTSPLLAQMLYPVPSQKTINDEKRLARQNLEKELNAMRRDMLESSFADQGIGVDQPTFQNYRSNPNISKAFQAYDEKIGVIEKEFQAEMVSTMHKIDQEHQLKQQKQENIGKLISRISPVSCYVYLITEISATGLLEMENFAKYSQFFQEKVQNQVYQKFEMNTYIFGENVWRTGGNRSNVNSDEIEIPHLETYERVSLANTVIENMFDVVMLLFYLMALPFLGFYVFDRYDVR